MAVVSVISRISVRVSVVSGIEESGIGLSVALLYRDKSFFLGSSLHLGLSHGHGGDNGSKGVGGIVESVDGRARSDTMGTGHQLTGLVVASVASVHGWVVSVDKGGGGSNGVCVGGSNGVGVGDGGGADEGGGVMGSHAVVYQGSGVVGADGVDESGVRLGLDGSNQSNHQLQITRSRSINFYVNDKFYF